MNYEDESYVKLYTRDTVTWLMLGWEGQAVFALLIRKVDRAGVLDVIDGNHARAVSVLTGVPLPVVETGLKALAAQGVAVLKPAALVLPRFLEAQEARKSDALRQRECRTRRRDRARAEGKGGPVVYFLQAETGQIKIGTSNDVYTRLVDLQAAHPGKLDLLHTVPGGQQVESEIHARFAKHRLRGEWFSPAKEILDFCGKTASQDVTSHEVTAHHSLSYPISAQPSQTEKEEIPPTPRDESKPNRLDDQFTATIGAEVSELFEAYKKTFGFKHAKLRSAHDLDAKILGDAIKLHGLASCLLVLKYALQDGKVNGTKDERKEKHESIGYLFDNQNTFNRILRAAEEKEKTATGKGGSWGKMISDAKAKARVAS